MLIGKITSTIIDYRLNQRNPFSHSLYDPRKACQLRQAGLKRVEELKTNSLEAAQRHRDWINWGTLDLYSRIAPRHALHLQEDISRAETHIIFYRANWVPTSKNPNDRFSIAGAGVYKLEDPRTIKIMETYMGYQPGTVQTSIVQLKKDYSTHYPDAVLTLFFVFMQKSVIHAKIGCAPVYPRFFRDLKYDPEWRKAINSENPPEKL
ncbi:hypothetical protein AX16_001198 [Volvariella volvacea WC 439]|nr:hypothetical protein AX16_001198 [Volvariella volvacea WC 439]